MSIYFPTVLTSPWPHFSNTKRNSMYLTGLVMGIKLLHICQPLGPEPGTDQEPKNCQLLSMFTVYNPRRQRSAHPSPPLPPSSLRCSAMPLKETPSGPKAASNSPLWAPPGPACVPLPAWAVTYPLNGQLVYVNF